MICFVDMDGVLVDFVVGIEKYYGIDLTEILKKGDWDFVKYLSIPKKLFWNGLSEEFWAKLPWTNFGEDLIDIVEERFGVENVCLFSTPTLSPNSLSGKYRWILKYLPQYKRRFLLGPPKSFCAHGKSLLIDDRDVNIDLFRKAGGVGILVPTKNNRLKEDSDNPLKHIVDQLDQYNFMPGKFNV